jgi:phage N-6-adenine-methyltransferase
LFPLRESHARELACVPEDRQLELFRQALKTSPNGLTAEHIKQTAAAMGFKRRATIFDDDVAGPTTRRHSSSGTHATPDEFHSAIEGRFGAIAIDLAASKSNAIVPRFFSREQNSLKKNWATLLSGGIGYLNPPFDPMAPWVDKSEMESQQGARLLVLCQASVGADWFWQMFPFCAVYALTPRLTFVGHKSGFPKDLILCAFNLVGDGVSKREVGRITRWYWQRENDPRLVKSY